MTSATLWAQRDNCHIIGKVIDTTGESLAIASVMLLSPIDSTLIEYTQADESGKFHFKGVQRQKYLLKINYTAYIPIQKLIDPTEKFNDLGVFQMVPITKELFEVVIRAAKAPLTIKGDTIEYDASTFKVPQGSTVEDLLKKLPGIEIDQQGNITSDGKNVNRVTVDGKSFFGGDPKAATKNLPAEGISKVQVFTDLTEEQKITGQKRLNSEKAMNLELKDEFKKGGFGKIIAGIGTEDTKEIKGNYNQFNTKHQFALVGSATNTGRNGLSWNDYQDFKGSNAFNWGDDGDFGFESGGNFRFIIFDDGDDEEGSVSSGFFGGDGVGFPEKASAGINYNFDNSKTKVNGMYFFELNNLYTESYRKQNFLYTNDPYNSLDTSDRDNKRNSHRLEFRIEQELDSFNSIIIKSNHSLGFRNTLQNAYLHNFDIYNNILNDQTSSSDTEGDNTNSQNAIIYRKKFKKKGRSLGLSAAYNYKNTERFTLTEVFNNFYQLSVIDSTGKLDQSFTTDQISNTYKANFLWLEPIGKKLSWRTFYNYNVGITNYDRLVSDQENNMFMVNNFLSRRFDNTSGFNRLGQSLNYSHQGLHVNLGLAYQEISLNSTFASLMDTADALSRKVYQNWIPDFEIEYEMNNNSEFSLDYSKYVNAPDSRDLLPIVDNTNPLFIKIGNTDLQPRIYHEVGLSIRKFNRLKFTNLWARINYSYSEQDIIYSTMIDERRVSTSIPINVTGTQSIGGNVHFGFPIIKNRFTWNFNTNINYRKDNVLVNLIPDDPRTLSYGFGARTNITPHDDYTFFLSGNYRFSEQSSGNTSSSNSKLHTYGGSAEVNIKFPWLIFLNSNFNVNVYRNDINDFESIIPILNLSVYKLFLKDNKGEVRLSAYDVFNKTLGVQQYSNTNRISQTETLSLAQYFILSFTYNMRGLKSTLDKGTGRRGGMMQFQ